MQQIIPIPVDIPAQLNAGTEAPSAAGMNGLFSEHLTAAAQQTAGPGNEIGKAGPPPAERPDLATGPPALLDEMEELTPNEAIAEEFVLPENGSVLPQLAEETLLISAILNGPALQAGSPQDPDNKQAISNILKSITEPQQVGHSKAVQDVPLAAPGVTGDASGKTLQGGASNTPADSQSAGNRINIEQLFQNQSIKNTLVNGETVSVNPEQSVTGNQTPAANSSLFGVVQQEGKNTAPQTPLSMDTFQVQLQAARSTGAQGSSTVTVESWSASFTSENGQLTGPSGLQHGQKPVDNKENGVPIGVYQNDKGQIITVSQQEDSGLQQSRVFSAGTQPTTDGSGQRQDITSNYMHSNLPNGSVKNDQSSTQPQQQNNNGDPQQQADKSMAADQLITKEPLGDKEPPLIFSLDPVNGQAPKTAPLSPVTATLFRMPSGLQVPDGTPMDQVINQLSTGKKLETGSVTLRLHPQELGELRMEIRVEQENIKAHITTQNPQAQEMLDRHLPRLREAMEQQGLRLEQVEITVADSNDDRQLFQNNQQQLNRPKTNQQQVPVGTLSVEEEPEDIPELPQSLNVMA